MNFLQNLRDCTVGSVGLFISLYVRKYFKKPCVDLDQTFTDDSLMVIIIIIIIIIVIRL